MISFMSKVTPESIEALEKQLEELLEASKRLSLENDALKNEMQVLKAERAELVENKERVRDQVEKMITRLKSLEIA